MLGDTASSTPEDPRYKSLIGSNVVIPSNRLIPIVADTELVDTGWNRCRKIHQHDFNDFAVGKATAYLINIMNKDSTINDFGGLRGWTDLLHVKKSKELENSVVTRFQRTRHGTSTFAKKQCSRKPMLSTWFVDMKPLANPAIEAVETGKTIRTKQWRIPITWLRAFKIGVFQDNFGGDIEFAWHCQDCNEVTVSKRMQQCAHCGSENLEQDIDVLDTWFFTMAFFHNGLAGKYPELQNTPTSVLITGFDIIFWVPE